MTVGEIVRQADYAIKLTDVRLKLGGALILDNVSLKVRRGEFLAIIGASGGGKSTLLRVIGGLLKPADGIVDVITPPAFVFQDYRLLPWRTVFRNVHLPIELNMGRIEVLDALKLVGMQNYSSYYPSHLSGGMRARVALARALAQASDVLLLDEPFAALDALVRERFNSELKHLHDKTGRTTVLVTHSIREAVYLADRVVVLRDGRIIKVLETGGQGRISAYTEGLENELRTLLGEGNSTKLRIDTKSELKLEWLLPILSISLGLIIWSMLALVIDQPFLLPSPMRVWQAFIQNYNTLLSGLCITAGTAIIGAFVGSLIGLLLGYPLGKLPWMERFLSPFLIASQSTPIVVLAPLLVAYLGYGTLSAIIVSALSALYPMIVATIVGVRETDRSYQELFRSLRARPWQILWYLELPGSLPILLGGMRLSLSLALIGAVVWEFVDPNQKGIGFQVTQAGIYFNKALQFAGIAILVLLGIVFYFTLGVLERYVLHGRRQV